MNSTYRPAIRVQANAAEPTAATRKNRRKNERRCDIARRLAREMQLARPPQWQALHDELTRLWVREWISFDAARAADKRLRAMEAAGVDPPTTLEGVL
jgi:hypothetical protein